MNKKIVIVIIIAVVLVGFLALLANSVMVRVVTNAAPLYEPTPVGLPTPNP